MFGEIQKVTKSNLLKGIPWRFGPNWPGKRCEAKKENPMYQFFKAFCLF